MSNRDVERVIEVLVEVWTEELVRGGRIELEGFCVLETQMIDRGGLPGRLPSGDAPRHIRRVILKVSRRLRQELNARTTP